MMMFKRRRDGEVSNCTEEYVRERLAGFATDAMWKVLVEAMKQGIIMRDYAEEFWIDDYRELFVKEGGAR